mgnify:CR=1 FL=1
MIEKEENQLSKEIISAAIEVHRNLGPGLLESSYETCLCYELSARNMGFEKQVSLPVKYKNIDLDCGYRLDVVVEKLVILEIKSVDRLTSINEAQLLTYLRLSELKLCMLINFNVPLLKNGMKRIVNNL